MPYGLVDVNGDGWLTPNDAVIVINSLNLKAAGDAGIMDSESVARTATKSATSDEAVDQAVIELAEDALWEWTR